MVQSSFPQVYPERRVSLFRAAGFLWTLILASVFCFFVQFSPGSVLAQTDPEVPANDNSGFSNADFGIVHFPGTGVWNGFNGHLAVAECVESGGARVVLRIVVLRNNGAEIGRRDFEIAPFGTTHTILNEFHDAQGQGIAELYGSYRIEALNVPSQARVSCLTSTYRLKPDDNSTVEYAYAIPVRDPLFGKAFGLYNSMDPLNQGRITLNYVSVFNPGTEPLNATLTVFSQDGNIDKVVPLDIAAGGRIDTEVGSDRGFVTGLYEVNAPAGKPYGAFIARYSPRPDGSGFNFAFAALASGGFCNQTIPVSTMGYATNWVELANPNGQEVGTTVQIRLRDGTVVDQRYLSLPSRTQSAVGANDAIDPNHTGNVGSVTVLCDASRPLVVQSTFYGRDSLQAPQIRWSYASLPSGAPAAAATDMLVGSVNVFLRAANWMKLANGTTTTHLPFYAVKDSSGARLLSSARQVEANGIEDIQTHETMAANSRFLGTIAVSGTEADTALGSELIRVYYDPAGNIAAIMPTPVTLIDDGAKLVASEINATAVENTTLAIQPPVSDPLGRSLKYEIVANPTHGTAEGGVDGIAYAPHAHYRGLDAFHYRATLNNVEPARQLASNDANANVDVDPRSAQFAGDANLLERYREDLTAEEVDSVLKRVAFGGTAEQRNIRTLTGLVNSLLDTPENVAVDNWLSDYNTGRLTNQYAENTTISQRWFFWGHFEHVPLYSLRYGNPSLNWWSFLFWHNHFTTDLSIWSNSGPNRWMVDHYRRLKRNALGNAHTFMVDMIHDGPFHEYLNSFTNTYSNTSENFPREWLELFSVGVADPVRKVSGQMVADPNFTEAEMRVATRALSGWGYQGGDVGYRNTPGWQPITPRNFRATDGRFLWAGVPRPYANESPFIKLVWDNMDLPGGASLRVRRSPAGQNNYSIIGAGLARDSGIWDDSTAVPGTLYDYVLDIVYPGNIIRSSQPDQGYIEFNTGVPSPQNIQCSRARTDGRVVLTWDAAAGSVAGYQIYRFGYDYSVIPTMLAQVSSATRSFTDLTATANESYGYFIRSVAADGTLSPLDELNHKNGNHVAPSAAVRNPTWTTASNGTAASVSLTWEAIADAARFRIYRSPGYSSGNWVVLAETPNNTPNYVDTTAEMGAVYTYAVISLDAQGRQSEESGGGQFKPTRWNQDSAHMTNLDFLTWLPDNHPNSSAKIVQARPISATGRSFDGAPPVLSFIDHVVYNWPAFRRNIAAKLFASVAHRQLNEQIVSNVASNLESSGYDIKETMRGIYSSSAMFAPESINTCVSSPVELMMMFLRRFDIPLDSAAVRGEVASALNLAGQTIFAPASVFGWNNCGLVRAGRIYDGSDWMVSAQTFISLANGVARTIWALTNYLSLPINSTLVPSNAIRSSAAATVDYIAGKLGVTINQAQRSILIEYLNTADNGSPSPWTGQENQRTRLSGLVRFLIASVDFAKK